jgi:hypothetical protein
VAPPQKERGLTRGRIPAECPCGVFEGLLILTQLAKADTIARWHTHTHTHTHINKHGENHLVGEGNCTD